MIYKLIFISDCTDDSHCDYTEECSDSTDGKCIDPCEYFNSQCEQGEMCVVVDHTPTCVGKYIH